MSIFKIILLIVIVAEFIAGVVLRSYHRDMQKKAKELYWANVRNTAFIDGLEEGRYSTGKSASDMLTRSKMEKFFEPFKQYSDNVIKETIDAWHL